MGREAILEVREGSRGPLGGLGGVERPSWMSGWGDKPSSRSESGWEALLQVWDGSGGPP